MSKQYSVLLGILILFCYHPSWAQNNLAPVPPVSEFDHHSAHPARLHLQLVPLAVQEGNQLKIQLDVQKRLQASGISVVAAEQQAQNPVSELILQGPDGYLQRSPGGGPYHAFTLPSAEVVHTREYSLIVRTGFFESRQDFVFQLQVPSEEAQKNDVAENNPLTVWGFRVRGHTVEPPTPLPIQPPASYFFVNPGGHPSAGMSMNLFRSANSIKVSIIEEGDEEASKRYSTNRISEYPLIPYQSFDDRIVHINLANIINQWDENVFNIDENYLIRLELLNPVGNIIETIDSPSINVYDRMAWVNQRLEYLSQKLFKMSYDFIKNLSEAQQEDRLWRLFAEARSFPVSFLTGNHSSRLVNDKTLFLYALIQAENQAQPTLKELNKFPIRLAPMAEQVMEYNFRTPELSVPELTNFQGLVLTLGAQQASTLTPDSILAQRRFTITMNSAARNASEIIARIQENDISDYSEAAELFRDSDFIDDQGYGNLGTIELKKAQAAAEDLYQEFQQFRQLIELRESLFESSDMGELQSLMAGDFDGVNLNFGIWIPNSQPGPSVYAPGWVQPGWDIREIVLNVSPHEIAMRTLGTVVTMGLSKGDLEVNERSALNRLRALQAQARPSEVNQWLSHDRIPDSFFKMDAGEMRAFFDKATDQKPFYQVRGELVEGYMSQQFARQNTEALRQRIRNGETFDIATNQWVSDNTGPSPDRARYIPGWDIRHRWKSDDGRQVHQQGNDGLGTTISGNNPATNMLVVHDIYEAKSGSNASEGQMLNHRDRINQRGVHLVEPSRDTLDHLKRQMALEPVKETIGGVERTVLYIPADRIHIHEQGNPNLFRLITPAQVRQNFPGIENLNVRDNQRKIDDFTYLMMDTARQYAENELRARGINPRRWDDHSMDLTDFKRFYADLPLPPERRISDTELQRRFFDGMRVDETGRWRNIYSRTGDLLNPYMGEGEYMDALRRVRPNMTAANEQAARDKFRSGQRWNPFAKRYTAGNYSIDPQGYMTFEEHREIIRRNWQANTAIETRLAQERITDPNVTREQIIREMYNNHERYNIKTQEFVRVAAPEAMSNPDITDADRRRIIERRRVATEPGRWQQFIDRVGSAIDRFDRSSVGGTSFDDTMTRRGAFRNAAGDAMGDLLQAAAAGSQEYARLREKKLKVKIAKKFNTAYMIVLEGSRRRGTNEYDWRLAGSRARQAALLQLYIQNSGSAWTTVDLPNWFAEAVSNIN